MGLSLTESGRKHSATEIVGHSIRHEHYGLLAIWKNGKASSLARKCGQDTCSQPDEYLDSRATFSENLDGF